MGQDVDGVLELGQGVHGVARGVLDGVFASDARRELRVGHDAPAQGREALQNVGMAGAEGRHAVSIAGVENRAVGQDDAQGAQGSEGVLVHGAAHARRVVGDDAAYGRGRGRGRVRADTPSEGRQQSVGFAAGQPAAQADEASTVQNLVCPPLPSADARHDVLARGLAVEARACAAKGHACAVIAQQPEQGQDFGFALDVHDGLGAGLVDARVQGEHAGTYGIEVEAVRGQDARQPGADIWWQHGRSVWSKPRKRSAGADLQEGLNH
ncbi:hypothetical protein DSECCO2_410610 [anaerobic digester metagenome]